MSKTPEDVMTDAGLAAKRDTTNNEKRVTQVEDAKHTVMKALAAMCEVSRYSQKAEIAASLDEAIGWLETAAKELTVIRKGAAHGKVL